MQSSNFFLAKVTRIEHRHIWSIFQRLMRVTRFEDEMLDRLRGVFSKYFDEATFAKQRNYLHYRNDSWLYDDLYKFLPGSGFGIQEISLLNKLQLNDLRSDFSMVIGLSAIHFGLHLLTSLSAKTHKIDADLEVINNSMTPDRHPLYTLSR